MKEHKVSFASEDLTLEGLIAIPESGELVRGAVVCHPHPLYGGSMYNNVVEAILEAMWQRGWATLRFNFRGVGGSGGEHSGGPGEAHDIAAAVNYLAGQPGVISGGLVLAGYSFGAATAVKAADHIQNLAALVLVALPLRAGNASALTEFSGPIILAAGDSDDYCPANQLKAVHKDIGERSKLAIIVGTDHFFGGYENELTAAVTDALDSIKLGDA